jgi:hypothetical protein
MIPKDKLSFVLGVCGVLIGLLNLHYLNSGYPSPIRYLSFLWFIAATFQFYRAYRTAR